MNGWRGAVFLATQDVRHMLRERETLVWLFVMPIVFFYFIGTVTSGFGGGGSGRQERLVVTVPEDAGFLGDAVIGHLRDAYDEVDVRPAVAADGAGGRSGLRLPDGFTDKVLGGETAQLVLQQKGAELAANYDAVRVARAAYTTLADVVAVAAGGGEPSPETLAELAEMPRALTLKVGPAGQRPRVPQGYEQTVPGILVMFTMLALLTSGASLLVIERNQGLLRRLASAPLSRGSVVVGKWLGRLVLGLTQIAYALLVGTLLFGMDWGPDVWMVGVVLLAWGALCASLGLWLGNLASTEGQAVGIGVLSANVLAALGGCWWPIEITPSWMQALQKALPTGWAMDALHRLVSFQAGPMSALPHVGVMLLAALVFGALAARRFRFL
ncbi:MAG: ABC transporter permease [Planctomycetota bacterium]